jgi:hypothetical protein
MQILHGPIKNIMEYVFATSPLLALSTNGWTRRISGAHLLTVSHLSLVLLISRGLSCCQLFNALGNNRPPILIRLEDQVLQAIVDISEGKPREGVMDNLYLQLGTMEKDLANDEDAMNWFNFTAAGSISSTPAPSDVRSTPLPGAPFPSYLFLYLNLHPKMIPRLFKKSSKVNVIMYYRQERG